MYPLPRDAMTMTRPLVIALSLAGVGLASNPVQAQTLPSPSVWVRADSPVLRDSVPIPDVRPDPIDPEEGLVPAIVTGAVVGGVMGSVDPDCAPASSRLQAAAIGAIWGGLWQLFREDRHSVAAAPEPEEEPFVDGFCDEPESQLH